LSAATRTAALVVPLPQRSERAEGLVQGRHVGDAVPPDAVLVRLEARMVLWHPDSGLTWFVKVITRHSGIALGREVLITKQRLIIEENDVPYVKIVVSDTVGDGAQGYVREPAGPSLSSLLR
jgi:hypothetical protein